MSDGKDDAGVDRSEDPFADHRVLDAEIVSNLRDGAVIDVNGTQLKLFQHNQHIPQMVEIYVSDEEKPIGTVNVATRETVSLGGVDEMLANRIEKIAEMPAEEIPEAVEQLAYRLNPAGREEP